MGDGEIRPPFLFANDIIILVKTERKIRLLRVIAASTLAFGWLFLAPASADDPITLGGQRIEDLNNKLSNLTDKTKTQELISIAEDKYNAAVEAQNARNASILAYENAVVAEATALEEKNLAETAVNQQTTIVATALSEKNSAQDTLDIANINLQTAQLNMQSAGGSGLQYTVYNLARVWPSIAVPDSVICSGTWNSNSMQLPVCGNRYENIVVKFTGQITVPNHWTSTYFAGYTDDGFKMYIDGQLAISNWVEQGVRWSEYSPVYDVTADKTFDVEIWWYNGGGPGSYHLGWAIPGGWTGAGCDYTGGWGVGFSCNLNTFSSGSGPTQEQINLYNEAVAAQQTAQTNYNNKLATYNTENQNLTTYSLNLTTATQNLTTAQQNLTNALATKNTANTNYNNAVSEMNDAISAAEEEYAKQWDFEEKQRVAAAIATALANQPQPTPEPTIIVDPTPEPTIDPTPEPTPEVTPDPEPTPEPTPEVTPDPEPTPEPTTEPTEEPTAEPTPEPTPGPEPTVEPTTEPEPTNNPEIKDEELAALIPEVGTGTAEDLSGVIANLTSKDNIVVRLTPEQIAAVSQTLKSLTQEAKAEIAGDLGISANEVAKIADQMKSNPALASAFVEFSDRAAEAGDAAMPFTLADAVTEVQTEAFLEDPLGAVLSVDVTELLSNFSELGMDMTDDQREKAQEVIIPVVIVSQIASTLIGMRR